MYYDSVSLVGVRPPISFYYKNAITKETSWIDPRTRDFRPLDALKTKVSAALMSEVTKGNDTA